jgi:hypothetical protein
MRLHSNARGVSYRAVSGVLISGTSISLTERTTNWGFFKGGLRGGAQREKIEVALEHSQAQGGGDNISDADEEEKEANKQISCRKRDDQEASKP